MFLIVFLLRHDKIVTFRGEHSILFAFCVVSLQLLFLFNKYILQCITCNCTQVSRLSIK